MPANAGDSGSTLGLERSAGGGNGNPVQYSCLENPMDRGAWWATVHGGHKESDMTERLSTHRHTHTHTHTHRDTLSIYYQIPMIAHFLESWTVCISNL